MKYKMGNGHCAPLAHHRCATMDNAEQPLAAPETPLSLPDYIPWEKYRRLSSPARQRVNQLLLNPPEDTEGYRKRKDRFNALGYRSQQHYLICQILEHLEYGSDVDESDETDASRSDSSHSDRAEEEELPRDIKAAPASLKGLRALGARPVNILADERCLKSNVGLAEHPLNPVAQLSGDDDVTLPAYISTEKFLRLDPYQREKILNLLASPPKDPPAYIEKKARFDAAGYESYLHYKIAGIMECLDYGGISVSRDPVRSLN